MTAAGTLSMESVDGAILERRQGMLKKAALVERVAVDRHLHIELVCHGQTVIDRSRCGAPILMQFQTNGTGMHLFFQRCWQADVTFAQEAQVHRESICCGQHGMQMPGSRSTGRGGGTDGWAGAAEIGRAHV